MARRVGANPASPVRARLRALGHHDAAGDARLASRARGAARVVLRRASPSSLAARLRTATGIDQRAPAAAIDADPSFAEWQVPASNVRARGRSPSRPTCPPRSSTSTPSTRPSAARPRAGDKTPAQRPERRAPGPGVPEGPHPAHRPGRSRRGAVDPGDALRPRPLRRGRAVLARPGVARGRAGGRAVGPERYREIRYEDLVADPAAGAHATCATSSRCRTTRRCSSTTQRADELLDGLRFTHHVQGIRRPPSRRVRDWRQTMPDHEVQLFEALAGDLLDELGYERSGLPTTGRARVEAAVWRTGTTVERGTRRLPDPRRPRLPSGRSAPAPTPRRGPGLMKLTFLGHAGVLIETEQGSILCDPWFHPAFFASWVPFPDNSGVDVDALRRPGLPLHLATRTTTTSTSGSSPSTSTRTRRSSCRTTRPTTTAAVLADLGFHRFVADAQRRAAGARRAAHPDERARSRRPTARSATPGSRSPTAPRPCSTRTTRSRSTSTRCCGSVPTTRTSCSSRARSGTRWCTGSRPRRSTRSGAASGPTSWPGRRGWSRRSTRP